jgi:hypothetical protein
MAQQISFELAICSRSGTDYTATAARSRLLFKAVFIDANSADVGYCAADRSIGMIGGVKVNQVTATLDKSLSLQVGFDHSMDRQSAVFSDGRFLRDRMTDRVATQEARYDPRSYNKSSQAIYATLRRRPNRPVCAWV